MLFLKWFSFILIIQGDSGLSVLFLFVRANSLWTWEAFAGRTEQSLSWCWQSGEQGHGLGWKLTELSLTFFEGSRVFVFGVGHPEVMCVDLGDWGSCHQGRVHTCVHEGGARWKWQGCGWERPVAGCWSLVYFFGTFLTQRLLCKCPFSFQNAPKAPSRNTFPDFVPYNKWWLLLTKYCQAYCLSSTVSA